MQRNKPQIPVKPRIQHIKSRTSSDLVPNRKIQHLFTIFYPNSTKKIFKKFELQKKKRKNVHKKIKQQQN